MSVVVLALAVLAGNVVLVVRLAAAADEPAARAATLSVAPEQREVSLVTKQPLGLLAVAGRLSIDLHAEFMVSRTYGTEIALNWYNCGYSGGGGEGGKISKVGGHFGDFGFHFPYEERDKRYPRAVTVGHVPAVRFDGNDLMKANFPIEPAILDSGHMAIEVWFRAEKPAQGEVILGWQSPNGKNSSAPLSYPPQITGSPKWRHLVVNCTPTHEEWYLDGAKVAGGKRKLKVTAGHVMVLGGASQNAPSFNGDLAAVRLHDGSLTEQEIARNHEGGVMLGTEMHNWWRLEPDQWWAQDSEHFRHCVEKEKMATWNEQQMQEFEVRVPGMFKLAELAYHCYSERMALRTSVVSCIPEERGDGIKYRIPIQPTDGANVMGFDGHFGWSCQGPGFINPHELVHGFDVMTGGMAGAFWETHANFPQTYIGFYQTEPILTFDSCLHPSNGRTYYHDRGMFEHLAQTPEYGPMFISKLWYDGPTKREYSTYPWQTFNRINPHPDRTLADEYTRMAMRNVTMDFVIYRDYLEHEKGNTPYGYDGCVMDFNRYRAAMDGLKTDVQQTMLRHGRVLLREIPYEPGWWRGPKQQAPQQLGWNICPLACAPGTVAATLEGYANTIRGADWRAGFVGVNVDEKPVYGRVFRPGERVTFDVDATIRELYLVVCAAPTRIMAIGPDYRSFDQAQFPWKVKLEGCRPLDVVVAGRPPASGAPHPNGGGLVAPTATVAPTAYVGPNARVLGSAKVLGRARIEDHAVVMDATVQDEAVVSGHALVYEEATIAERARVRGFAVVQKGTTIRGNAKILEHARMIAERKTCSDNVTVKGGAVCYGGDQSGTAMIDGFYAKGNDITKGRWFTWSWGVGKNPGEDDTEFGGLYADYDFNTPHDSLALEAFGATWGYLVNGAKIEMQRDRDHGPKWEDAVIPAIELEWPPSSDGSENQDKIVEQMVGYITPPASGEYTFWIAADGQCEVLLGDANAEVADTLIGPRLTKGTPPKKFDVHPEQKLGSVALRKGRTYPIMVLHAGNQCGGHVSVAWSGPGADQPQVIGGPLLSLGPKRKVPGIRRRLWPGKDSIDRVLDDRDYSPDLRPETVYDGAVRLDGMSQFVELQPDVADMLNCTYTAEVNWDGASEEAHIFEFSNPNGDAIGLFPAKNGQLVFAMRQGKRLETLSGPPLKKNVWTMVQVVLDGSNATLSVDGVKIAKNNSVSIRPHEISATQCYLGRGAEGGHFGGLIGRFTVHSVPVGRVSLPAVCLSPWDEVEVSKIRGIVASENLPTLNTKGLFVQRVSGEESSVPLKRNDVIIKLGKVTIGNAKTAAEALDALAGMTEVEATVMRLEAEPLKPPRWKKRVVRVPLVLNSGEAPAAAAADSP